MEFVDPHLHLWDTRVPPPPPETSTASEAAVEQQQQQQQEHEHHHHSGMPVHSAEVLGPPARLHPVYTHEHYVADMAQAAEYVKLVAAVHVEAIPNNDIAEATWVAHHVRDASVPFAMVCRVDLSHPRAADELAALKSEASAASKIVVGVRMILNWEPTWPKVARGDFLTSMDFERGYAALAVHNLSFDLQANPHQLLDAAALAAKYPTVPVIVNHLGCLKLPANTTAASAQTDPAAQAAIAEWRAGMQALASAGKLVFVKLSMLCYTDPDWDRFETSAVPGLVREVLDMFGSERCMFASNYPVDKADGWSPTRLFRGFVGLCDHLNLTNVDRQHLFSTTARTAYRL